MILNIVILILVAFTFWAIGGGAGRRQVKKEMEGTCGLICDDCEREIFENGWNSGVEYVLVEQAKAREQIINAANMHIDRADVAEAKPKRKYTKRGTKKVAVKKAAKKVKKNK